MARRASSSTNPYLIIGIVILVIGVIFGGKFILSDKKQTFTDVNLLQYDELIENGNSLRNNEYLIEGTVDERFFRDGNSSSVVSMKVKSDSGEELIPVIIPSALNKNNIERELRYAIKVKIEQGGIPVATHITRL